jgi:hypothetical protein
VQRPQRPAQVELPAKVQVGGRVEVGCQGQILVHRLDAEKLGVQRPLEVHRPAVQQDLPTVRPDRPAERLDQRALTGSVVPDERDDLTRVGAEVRALQGVYLAVPLGQAARGEQGLGHGYLLTWERSHGSRIVETSEVACQG